MPDENTAVLTRVERDARGWRTRFEELEVGKHLGSLEWSVNATLIQALCESDDDYHEWYTIDSPYGGIIAPVLIGYPPVRLLFSRQYNVRGLFYDLHIENVNPIRPGKRLIATGRLSDKWIKRDREYVAYEGLCVDEDGLVIYRTRRAHVLDYIKRSAPRSGEGLDSGAAAVDDAIANVGAREAEEQATTESALAASALARREGYAYAAPLPGSEVQALDFSLVTRDTPVGWRLPAVSRQMSQQQFRDRHEILYGENVWPEQNLHADAEAAAREGLSAPVASAPTIFALITRMMMTTFGDGWIRGGTFSAKMIKPVYPNNFVTARGTVIEKREDAGRTRLICDVSVTNELGEKVIVGTASGLTPA